MIPYLSILFLVLLFVSIEQYSLNRRAYYLPVLFLCIFSTVRSNDVGTDSKNYTANYLSQFNPYANGFNDDIEYGYQALDSIIIGFTYDYFWLFLLTSIFIVSLYLKVIKKISINYFYSIFIYITFGFYTFFFNGLRQGIAMAICFFALPFLIEKRVVWYFITVLVASFFHSSALIMLLVYFLVNLKIRLEFKFLICFIISLSGSKLMIQHLAENNTRYESYTTISDSSGGYLTLIFYFLIGLFVYLSGTKLREKDVNFNTFEQILLCGLALVIPVTLIGTDPSGPQRIFYYFNSVVIFLIPYLLKKYNISILYIFFFLFSIIYFILITSRFSGLVPFNLNPIFEVF